MKCRRCGYALSNNRATCPNCGTLMSEEQLKLKKEINGINNPYMERLNKLNQEKIKNNLQKNEEPKSIKQTLIIIGILLLILLVAYILL